MAKEIATRLRPGDAGFTLVELMVVVLIIGVLVTIATPVYTRSRLGAEAKSCQANQRTIVGSIEVARESDVSFASASAGQFAAGASGWYELLVPGWIRTKPACPVENSEYYLSLSGDVLGDRGAVQTFKDDHQLH